MLKLREDRIAEDLLKEKIQRENARVIGKEKRLEAANIALKLYLEDSHFRALHDSLLGGFIGQTAKNKPSSKVVPFHRFVI